MDGRTGDGESGAGGGAFTQVAVLAGWLPGWGRASQRQAGGCCARLEPRLPCPGSP